MQNEKLLMKSLDDHQGLLRIALDWEDGLAERFGYPGNAAFVAIWEDGETDTLRWFDGAFGATGDLKAWRTWREQKVNRIALRGIPLIADFTESTFGLLIDRMNERYYVGRLAVLREILAQLIREQGMGTEVDALLKSVGINPEYNKMIEPEQLTKILRAIDALGTMDRSLTLH